MPKPKMFNADKELKYYVEAFRMSSIKMKASLVPLPPAKIATSLSTVKGGPGRGNNLSRVIRSVA